MLKQVYWSEDRTYRTGTENEPIKFYLDGLCNSKSLDLLLGYFSSAAINILSLGFATFLNGGGTVRLIINNILSQQDADAILLGRQGTIKKDAFDLRDISALFNILNHYGKHFFECLAWLISNGKIRIVIVQPKDGKGISHYKSGIFSDGNDMISFKASCNFTAYGLLENLEELECNLSWENGSSKIMGQTKYFESIFSGNADFIEYLEVEDILIAIKNEFGNRSLNELIIQEKELLEKRNLFNGNTRIKKIVEKIISKIEEKEDKPRFPYAEGPRSYQIDAYNNWVNNNYQGIFAMATGTGKTITALNCLFHEFQRNHSNVYHAVILVPTLTLVDQWKEEALKFNFKEIIKVSSLNDWESELATILSTNKRIPTSFIIISTYASFIKDRFNKYVKQLPGDTLFMADEAHNIVSKSVLNKLISVPLQKRIGLSATPKRIYDPEGNVAMETFFGDREPYTYSFTMERAIEEGILCKYYYHPHIVKLNAEELSQYIEITNKLSKFFNRNSGDLDHNDIVQKLLLKRKRIIHKAVNKLAATKAILNDRFAKEGNLKYTFIYVPEGIAEDEIDNGLEEEMDTQETIKLINQYTREIGKINSSIKVNQFISGMKDRDEILDQFKEGKIHVIASMKCLDEGVDIPRAEHAIFCSSTGNPRQFIQRRGRILRTHPNKHIAVIHDLVVIPDFETGNNNSDTFKTERSLVEKELERVMYFASLSINPFETENVFLEVCQHYDLNIYTIHNKLKNND